MSEQFMETSGLNFPTEWDAILDRVDRIDPIAYGRSRNFIDGAVTRLSPYISRGVISTRFVMERLFAKGYRRHQMEKLLQELAWRDYFQRVGQHRPDLVGNDLKNPQQDVRNNGLPQAILNASTGIEAVDASIRGLYETGYMHNHFRMYTASLACNMAKSHWRMPAQWMYHHLLDADFASNACSWQWVCGAFSSKKYYANQENINRYGHTKQKNSYLDADYDEIMRIDVPDALKSVVEFKTIPILPSSGEFDWDPALPVHLYNAYNLDPQWRSQEPANRILLLEPSHFEAHPMCSRTMDFILSLAENIPGILVFSGEFVELKCKLPGAKFVSREHPLFAHWEGTRDTREWMFPEVSGWYPSFFGFWKKCERLLAR